MVHGGDAGIVDQHVQPAEFLANRGEHVSNSFFIGDIHLKMVVIPGFEVSILPAATGNDPTLIEKIPCYRTADTPIRPGDQNHLRLGHLIFL
jgi:hypothetical protein